MRIILASNSPRRQLLLKCIVRDFTVIGSDADEAFNLESPSNNVMNAAKSKALSIVREKDDLVIGADTTVYMGGKYYNKPVDEKDAEDILKALNGREHEVYTGVCIVYKDIVRCFYDKSAVKFNTLSEEFIKDYISSGLPMDKAGAYGIQDEGIVQCYKGDYTNIMGLPVGKLRKELREMLNGKNCC